jgi:type III restriction enzyme
MRISLREYQGRAVKSLLLTIRHAQQGILAVGTLQGIQFSAPTGTGKTVMLAAVIEGLLVGNEHGAAAGVHADPDLTFLWLSDMPDLNQQSLRRIQDTADGLAADALVEIDQNFDRSILEPGRAYFLNYQKLRSGSLLTRLGDERTQTIWETIAETQRVRPGKLLVVIDEAHRGLGRQNENQAQTTASKFVRGAQAADGAPAEPLIRRGPASVPFPPMALVIGMSATPERFAAYLTGQGGRALTPVTVTPGEVRGSGLIKDRLVLNGPQEGDVQWTLLSKAIDRTLEFERRWRDYTTASNLPPVAPALLIQVEDGSGSSVTATDLTEIVRQIHALWPVLRPNQVVHCFNGFADLEPVSGWLMSYREPNSISDDAETRIVLFKTALNTGWDCPRAEVLMSFRTLRDQTAIAQLVGRMVRTPLGIRVPGDETLNSTHLFLPLFDPAQLERVKAYLESDIGETGAEIDLGTDNQELVVRPGGEELFERMKTLPTVVVPPGRPIPDIRRLLRTARLLDQDGLATGTTAAAVNSLIALMADQLTAGDVEERAAARGQFTLHSLTVEGGLVVAVDDQEEAVSREDIQAAFRANGLLVAEELSLAWLRYRYDTVGSQQAKLEFLAITSNAGLLQRIQVKARELLSALEAEYRARIIALPPARVDLYASLQRSGRIAQSAIMAPYARVVFPMPDAAVQVPSHLYVQTGTADDCRMELNTWEAETLVEERRRPGFKAFLRNLPNKRWALSYAYDYNGLRPGFPDFLIFRDDADGNLTVDIMEPHLDSGDSVAKAHGLARFALENPGMFGRVEMLRKSSSSGPLYRLSLGDSVTAGAILDSVLTAADLNSAFASRGYVADW